MSVVRSRNSSIPPPAYRISCPGDITCALCVCVGATLAAHSSEMSHAWSMYSDYQPSLFRVTQLLATMRHMRSVCRTTDDISGTAPYTQMCVVLEAYADTLTEGIAEDFDGLAV